MLNTTHTKATKKTCLISHSPVFTSWSLSLLDEWVDVARRQNAIRIRTHAQIVHVVGNLRPAMRHICRNDDNVADLNHSFDYVIAGDRSAAGRTIQHPRDFAVFRRLASVHN